MQGRLTVAALLLLSCLNPLQSTGSPSLPRYDRPKTVKNYEPLKIGAFNIQVFGSKKMSLAKVKDIIVKIILRYDIMLVQEIRSSTDKAINGLLKAVNKASLPENIYSMVLSKRLGRSVSKEQYAFIYRRDRLNVIDKYIFDDAKNNKDVFQREPFIVKFNAPDTYLTVFALVAIHTQPSNAPSEIDHLVDVYDDIVKRMNTKNVLILGDFNAGCRYVTNAKWKGIRLATDHRFYWLFTDEDDSTVAKSNCPYDRMVVGGKQMIKAIVPKSEKVFNFAEALGLTQDMAKLVSDHWVIKVKMKDRSYLEEEQSFLSNLKLTILNKQKIHKISKTAIYKMKSGHKNSLNDEGFSLFVTYKKTGGMLKILLTKRVTSLNEAHTAVHQLNQEFPELVSAAQVVISARKLGVLVDKLKKSCEEELKDAHLFEYQVIASGACFHKFKLSTATLLCNVVERSCHLEFLFKQQV